ncbi:MAG: SDR family NAD(P)-dependent oxidoreductase [Chloroflexota bacterium]
MNIHKSRIILTGAASGIGKALLAQLATYDAQILAVDINPVDLPSAKARLYAHTADLTKPDEIDSLFQIALEKMDGVDIFIANAGFAYFEKIGAPDWERIERIYRLNVFSPMYALQKMQALNSSNPYCVVMTASAMAKWALPGYALYSSTKAALDSFADAFRYELEPNGRLMLVYPIATRTNFFKTANDDTPVPWPTQTPEVAARAVISGIEHNKNAVFPSSLFLNTWRLGHIIPGLKGFYQILQNQSFQRWLKNRNKVRESQ